MRRLFLALFGLAALAGLAGCPGAHKQPTGPAPEYEEPPAPSWMKDGGATQPAPAPAVLPIDPVPSMPAPASDGGVS